MGNASDRNDVIMEIFKARGLIVGSSTINKGILSDLAALLEMVKGMKFKNKIGAAFGSYGWSGESVKILEEGLKESGIEIVSEGIRAQYDPTPEDLQSCEALGEAFAAKI
ncbi:MAG: flavodoxin domain-containing protein [Desulfotomaculaceae bacterium]